MTALSDPGGAIKLVLAASITLLFLASTATAQTLNELNRRIEATAPDVSAGQTNPQAASDVIDRLDKAEADFAEIAEGGRGDRADLFATYGRLEEMLDRLYRAWQKRKDDCVETIDNGGSCDYNQPEQLALRALYPLSWLRFEGAALYAGSPSTARHLLNEAIDGFTDSSLLILSPELIRENLLGRAYAERALGRYDREEYSKAIADFKRIINDGPGTGQYRAAEQGLASTYTGMGRSNEARGLTDRLAAGSMTSAQTSAQRNGLEMLHLRDLFASERTASDPAQRAALHRQIVDFARARENDKDGWAIAVASAAQYCSDPAAEFGASGNAFENWYLANVLYYKHQTLEAAKYYWEAAKSGQYPKAYKYAADLYYLHGRFDMVEQIAADIARQPGSPDAQWAAYMLFKIPRLAWERSGMTNGAAEKEWVTGAEQYLKNYPHGQYAFEPRFRLAERLQRQKDYVGAAQQYEQVSGNPDYEFTARFNAADAYYQALGGKALEAPQAAAPSARADQQQQKLRAAAVKALREATALEPAAETEASATQRQTLHESRGRAIYMLATLLESEPQPDYREIASILTGFETQYPSMKDHFDQTFEWRLVALDHIGDYAALNREVATLVARNNLSNLDYVKELGLDFWKSAARKSAAGDHDGYVADARLTAATYDYFARMVDAGKIPPKNLTGTLSILGQAYLALNQPDRAEAVFNQVVRADQGSPDANAGLAQIAQTRKDFKDALELWTRVESTAAESDPLFYEAKYQLATILAQEGNAASACNELTVTRGEHPNLGSPEMKSRWGDLERKTCQSHTEG